MRLSHGLSALSLGLLSLTLGGEALAAKGLVIRTGPFPAAAAATSARPSPRALESSAKTLLLTQIPAASGAELGAAATVDLASGERIVKLPQLHQGLPVALRGAAVGFSADGSAQLITASLEDDLPSSVTPQITAADAASVASAAAGVAIDPAGAKLSIWPTPNGAKLVWALSAPLLAELAYQPVVVVDAATGEIVLRYNAITSLHQANVYPTNPVKSPTLQKVTLDVGAGQTTLQNELVKSLNCIDTQKVKAITLMGITLNVHVCELFQTAMADGAGDFLSIMPAADTAPEDAFSELSMFHHVNHIYSFFRGYKPDLVVEQGPIPTISNLRLPQGFDTFDPTKFSDPKLPLAPLSNAFFAPANPLFSALFGVSGGAMFFGQGPLRDFSYDADVIYHEFTHAVVNATLKLAQTPHLDEYGVSYSPGAMNEGLADYFSSAITGDPNVGEYAAKDIDPQLTAIRSLTSPDTCPTAIGGEVHQDATLFSGSLWDVRTTLTPEQQAAFDGVVFKAMNSSMTGDLAYEDFAKLVLAAIEGSTLGKPIADALTSAFTKRGLLPKCTRLLESTGAELSGPKELKGLWFAPGTQTLGAKATTGGYSPGVVQVHQTLPANTGKLTVTFTRVDVGGGAVLGTATPFTPKLLVRFGAEPIKFTTGPLNATADVVLADPVKNATAYSAIVTVPKGATDAYVMIGNTGDSDGAYTALKLAAAPVEVDTSSASSGGSGGGGGGPMDEPENSGGCGCAIPGQESGTSGAAIAALGALALLAARRRKSA